MLSPEASMNASRIAPEPMISFSPFPQRSRVQLSRSVWVLVALCITLWGCVEAQSCGYSGTTYDCDSAGRTSMPSSFRTSTTHVYLQFNQIRSIPVNAFQGLRALLHLWLYNNRITSIPVNAFQGLTALIELDLDDNQIRSIPVNAFQGLTALTLSSFFNNQITSLPLNIFQGLTSLARLGWDRNLITSIPLNTFRGLTALTYLNLRSNLITSIPLNAFQDLTAITEISLRSNQITSMPLNAFEGLTALVNLYWTFGAGNNPLICSPAEGLNWQRPFVCSSCRNGLDFYQNSQFYICSSTPPTTSHPTSSPTVSPTISHPTSSPTVEPTISHPTSSPTVEPTISHPTSSPTISHPTSSPTVEPTISHPTSSPTVSPTISHPTSSPTAEPTISHPTSSPTAEPTISHPTSSPTAEPTISHPASSPTEPTFSPSVSPTTISTEGPSTSNPTTSPMVLSSPPSAQSSQSDSSDSSLYIIIAGLLVVVIFLIAVIRYRRAHKPATLPEKNNHITSNPAYAVIESTYETDPNNPQYEIPMRHNPLYDRRTSGYIEIEVPQPYALLETSHKTYETTGVRTSLYDVATTMTSFDSHPYDNVVDMSSKIEDDERVPQPYALVETQRKAYEKTGVETSGYDVATMMTSFDSHPYDQVVEMSSTRDTGSFA